MNILKILDHSRWIPLHQSIVKELGFEAATIISDMSETYNYAEEHNELVNGEYFYYTQSKCEERWGIKEDSFFRRIKELKERQIIDVKKIGIPCRNYYKLNTYSIVQIFEKYEVKSTKIDSCGTSSRKMPELEKSSNLQYDLRNKFPQNAGTGTGKMPEHNINNNINNTMVENEKNAELEKSSNLKNSLEIEQNTIPYHDLKLTASFLEKLQTEQPKYFLPMSKWIGYKLEREHNFSNVQNIQFELDSMTEIVKETGLDPDYLVDWNISKNYLKLFKPEKKENNSVISENNQVKREEIDEYDIKNMPKIKEEDEIIRRLKERIYKNFGYYIYSAWFSDIIFDRHNLQHKQRLIIRCGNQFILDKIEKNYLKDIVYPGNIIKLGLESLVKEVFKENEEDNEETEIVFTKDKEA